MSAQVVALKPVSKDKQDDVVIHVRFHPNADVNMIDERPAHLTPNEWLSHLWAAAPEYFHGLAGGRGFFRVPREAFEAIRAKA